MTKTCELSIVATVFRDADIVEPLVTQIIEHCEPIGISYEIILVDDGSGDNSPDEIEKQCGNQAHVKGLLLSRNFGQQIAVSAGVHHASGRFVLVMDGDLQNPPSSIPDLYREIQKGYDIVYGVSEVRNSVFHEILSKTFWFFITSVMGVKIVKNQLMMRIMSRRFVDYFNKYGETTRVVAGITQDVGMSSSVLRLPNRRRVSGRSGYTFLRRMNLCVDLVLALSTRPLDALIYIGVLGSMLSFGFGAWHLYSVLVGEAQTGVLSVVLPISLFGCVNLLMLGVIGKYLSNIYQEVRGRPLYFVQKKIGL